MSEWAIISTKRLLDIVSVMSELGFKYPSMLCLEGTHFGYTTQCSPYRRLRTVPWPPSFSLETLNRVLRKRLRQAQGRERILTKSKIPQSLRSFGMTKREIAKLTLYKYIPKNPKSA
jgi:hypothetical protein